MLPVSSHTRSLRILASSGNHRRLRLIMCVLQTDCCDYRCVDETLKLPLKLKSWRVFVSKWLRFIAIQCFSRKIVAHWFEFNLTLSFLSWDNQTCSDMSSALSDRVSRVLRPSQLERPPKLTSRSIDYTWPTDFLQYGNVCWPTSRWKILLLSVMTHDCFSSSSSFSSRSVRA